jgi:hypothetical protein
VNSAAVIDRDRTAGPLAAYPDQQDALDELRRLLG